MAEALLKVPEITCDGCAAAIRKALGDLPGVRQVNVDVPRREVAVAYAEESVALPAIRQRIERAGFDVEA